MRMRVRRVGVLLSPWPPPESKSPPISLESSTSATESSSSSTATVLSPWSPGSTASCLDQPQINLPAQSSCGIQVLDLNRDGYLEIVVHNHILNGRHDFGAYIYWGGPGGYNIDRRSHLPTSGTHMSNILEPGNVYSRRLEEKYISPPISKPASRRVLLHWEADTHFGTGVRFQTRGGSERELDGKEWTGPSGPESYFTVSGSSLPESLASVPWIQYRAVLTTPDGGNSPVLKEVSLECVTD